MAIPLRPLARAAAIRSSGLETPSPEKNECVCRSMLSGMATVFSRSLHELFNKNSGFGFAFLVNTIELVVVEATIVSGFVEQFRVCADLLNPARIHYDDLIGRQNRREPMSDGDHSASRGKFRQGLLNFLFRFRIER